MSPVEEAYLLFLASRFRDMGFEFINRTSQHMHIDNRGTKESYKLLNILEFDSTRKRMSVILEHPDGTIKIYCKGADNIIFERLSESALESAKTCEEHLHLFAQDGLRTLVLAQRTLDRDWFAEWTERYNAAETSGDNREEKIAEVAKEVEIDLELVGATAIEDKLQIGVPDAIAKIKAAGVKVSAAGALLGGPTRHAAR